MPDVRPFRAWRYDSAVAGALDDLLCPPYDVISPATAKRLLANPRNVIQLELGPGALDAGASNSRYSRAGATLHRWIDSGVLRRDAAPSLYVYEQQFYLGGQHRRRLAFFAAVRITPWEAGEVLPHEVTLAAPKEDRLALLEKTRTNISPIYALCDGGLSGVTALLSVAAHRPPVEQTTDDVGDHHRLWVVDDAALIEGVKVDLAGRLLYIADGHHRYETALAYAMTLGDDSGWEGPGYVLAGISPVDDPGLVVLPTHRLIKGLDPGSFGAALARLEEAFEVEAIQRVPPFGSLQERLEEARADHAMGLYTPGRALVLRPRMPLGGQASRLDPISREIDAALLQALLFEGLLGLTQDDLCRQKFVDYTRDADEARHLVDNGRYLAAVLLNPTPPAAIVAVARARARMPQKSTYFYPKLVTGLVLRGLE